MSSAEDDFTNEGSFASGTAQRSKKRRIQRACDVCRRKKIRCDGGQIPGQSCSNCISCGSECTYVEAAKKRGPSKGYVADLENRLRKMEKLLSKLAPDGELIQELGERGNWFQTIDAKPLEELPASITTSSYLRFHKISTTNVDDSGLAPYVQNDENDDEESELAINMGRLRLDPVHHRFFGKSSGITMVQAAINMKNEYTGIEDQLKNTVFHSKRPEYWTVCPWEVPEVEVDIPDYDFPDDDLMADLIDLYFDHVNIFIPVLHRPTLEKSIADGFHHHVPGFGEIILLVCAIGARYSNDSRVFLENIGSEFSAGWKWFIQIHTARRPRLTPPCLYDLQVQYLSVAYLHGSSAPQSCWAMVGVGIRLAQEVGAHRRKTRTSALTLEDELWKRAFWALISLDRFLSSTLGRPCATQDEDFDVDFPVECDDEYWEHPDPEKSFKQPLNQPSKISYFIAYLKLTQILAFALRTVYATNKAKVMLGFMGHQWDQRIVAELDSALNKWTDEVPNHLRWDPNQQDNIFFNQSACLHAWYHHLQILVHRPFISFPQQPSPLSFPSLTICTNAARSCSHIIDIQQRRNGAALPHLHIPLFTACIVLLVKIWGGKRSGLSTITHTEIEDVQKCMRTLKINEKRWHLAGRLWDILYELANTGRLSLLEPISAPTNKHERDHNNPKAASSSTASSGSSPRPTEGQRDIIRSQGEPADNNLSATLNSATEFQYISPPIHSDESNRLSVRSEPELMNRNNERMDAINLPWISAFGGTSSTPGQPLAVNSSEAYIGPGAFPAPSDQLFYREVGNEFLSSFGQPLDNVQGHSYGLYPTHVNPNQHQFPQSMIDSNTIAMWNHAPTGFELDDWDNYTSELNLGQRQATYQQGF